jgi:hypothetical protein
VKPKWENKVIRNSANDRNRFKTFCGRRSKIEILNSSNTRRDYNFTLQKEKKGTCFSKEN